MIAEKMDKTTQLPFHLDAEQSILCSAISGDAKEIFSDLAPHHFYPERHQIIATAIISLISENKSTDLVSVVGHLQDLGQLENAGGASYISKILKDIPASTHTKTHIEQIKAAAQKRAVIYSCLQTIESCRNGGDVGDIVDRHSISIENSMIHGIHEIHAFHDIHDNAKDSRSFTPFHDNSRSIHAFSRSGSGKKPRFSGNLSSSIRDYVAENEGSFTHHDIDREFGLVHPADKTLRRRVLANLIKDNFIKRDTRISSKYYIIKNDLEFIDFDQTECSYFDISLPLDLDLMVNIPRKSIIIIAGTSNAGKTAIVIKTLIMNIGRPYQLMYLMSEMGPSEYKQRIFNSGVNVDEWKSKVLAADVTSQFDDVIKKHNPDGLTVIDFLEEVEGEYYRIASDIRSIYDALDEGVAIICLQKKSGALVGRGGEATAEKPRLYINLDTLIHDKAGSIASAKIYKAKDYAGDNPNGLERHVLFRGRGSIIEPLSKWMFCNNETRAKWVKYYEEKILSGDSISQPDGGEGLCFYFKTISGKNVRVVEKDILKWRESFKWINVDGELSRIANKCLHESFLKDDQWFFQISGILSKKNKEAAGKVEG